MHRVPFSLPDVGLSEVKGFVYLDEDYLVLNLQQSMLGMIETDKDVFKIEPGAVRDLTVRRGFFQDRLVVTPKKIDLLEAVPGEHRVAVELRIPRKYREEVERLVEAFWLLADRVAETRYGQAS